MSDFAFLNIEQGGSLYESFKQRSCTFYETVVATFAVEETERVLAALALMVELHADQAPRPDGSPYVEHPLQVAELVLSLMEQPDADLVIAALLHDAVEDQAKKLADLAARWEIVPGQKRRETALAVLEAITHRPRIAQIVRALTNPPFTHLLAQRGIHNGPDARARKQYREAKNDLYREHIAKIVHDPAVALIKFCDFSFNALSIDTITDPAKRVHYLRKYTPVVQIFANRLRDEQEPVNILPARRRELAAELVAAQRRLTRQLSSSDK